MKYLFLMYGSEDAWTEQERQECMIESMGIGEELAKAGKFITSAPLQYVSTACCVRVREGKTLMTAGPFAETTEQLGGFYLLDLENLDEAIEVAARLPPAKKGTVEIRPIVSLPDLPQERFDLIFEHSEALSVFMLLCYDDEEYWTAQGPEVHGKAIREAVSVTHELAARDRYINASPLHSVNTATSVQVRNGRKTIIDGPFAETREVLGDSISYLLRIRTKR